MWQNISRAYWIHADFRRIYIEIVYNFINSCEGGLFHHESCSIGEKTHRVLNAIIHDTTK